MTYGTDRMYILVNKDLGMSIGKTAAQVAHAVARLKSKHSETVIVLQATGEQLKNLERYLDQRKIKSYLYIDEGVNEIAPYSVTVLAVEPIEYDDFDLFKDFELLAVRGRRWRS